MRMRFVQAVAVVAAASLAQGAVFVAAELIAMSGDDLSVTAPFLQIVLFAAACGLVSGVVLILPPFWFLAAKGRLGLWTALGIGAVEAVVLTGADIVLSGGFIGMLNALVVAPATLVWGLAGTGAGWGAWRALERPVRDKAGVF